MINRIILFTIILVFNIFPTKAQYQNKAFRFEIIGENGKSSKLEDFKGNYVLITFWNAKSLKSPKDTKHYEHLYSRFKEYDIEFITIITDKVEDNFSQDMKKTIYRLSTDEMLNSMLNNYKVKSYPHSILISTEGLDINTNISSLKKDFIENINTLLNEYKSSKSTLYITDENKNGHFFILRSGVMTETLFSKKITNSITANLLLEKPEFLSYTYRNDSVFNMGHLWLFPGSTINIKIDKEYNISFDDEISQFVEKKNQYYKSSYPKLKEDTIYNQERANYIIDIYREIENDILSSGFNEGNKKILLGYFQASLLDKLFGRIATNKVFGKTTNKLHISPNYSKPILYFEFLNEITNLSNWFESYQEFLYAKIDNNLIGIKSRETYITDMAKSISDPLLKEEFLMSSAEKEFYQEIFYKIEERFENVKSQLIKTKNIDKIDSYLKEIPDIKKIYENALPGTDLSQFSFLDRENKKTPLSEFKGNYVFIDVWSTDCNPCIGEMPYIKQMENKFERKPIVWVSISMDNKMTVWKKFLEDNEMNGIQLISEKWIDDPFFSTVGIIGIPHFILLDKQGKVIDYNSIRPSSPILGKLLEILINESE